MSNSSNPHQSGKVLTVLFIIIAILLVSLTAISLFFFQKEIEKRKSLETQLEASHVSEVRLETELGDLKKEKFLLDEKNKELDEKVNDLTGEVELEQGISKQVKTELALVKDQLDKEAQKNQKLQEQLKRLADLEQENITFRSQFEDAKSVREDLEQKTRNLEEKNQELMNKIASFEQTAGSPTADSSVNLDRIVVSNQTSQKEGRVLTVDTDTHFAIVSLGAQDGLQSGSQLAVYRADKYLGDLQVTQAQDDMSAADFLPPLSSRAVRKDDRVVVK